MNEQRPSGMYSIREVAERLGLSYKTVWKWARIDRTIKCVVYATGTVRIPEAEVERLMTMPVSETPSDEQPD